VRRRLIFVINSTICLVVGDGAFIMLGRSFRIGSGLDVTGYMMLACSCCSEASSRSAGWI
jgi:hypothetical protein